MNYDNLLHYLGSGRQLGKSALQQLILDRYMLEWYVSTWKFRGVTEVIDRYFRYQKTYDFSSLEECVAYRKYIGMCKSVTRGVK